MRRGFTLLELILVIVILSLSLVLIPPSLSRISKTTELKGAAQKIAAILRHSRSEAVHKGRIYQVSLQSEQRQVQVQELKPTEEEKAKEPESPPPRLFSLPDGIFIREIELNPSRSISEFPTIEFYPSGGSNGGSFLVKGEAQKGYRIKIHWISGMVEIEKIDQ